MTQANMDLVKKLGDLGTTDVEVADCLISKNMKGTPQSSCNCPVANYLKSLGCKDVHVDPFEIHANGEIIGTTIPIQMFIRQFDQRLYPSLILR